MEELELALSVLKTGKAPGPDEITNETLKNLDKGTKSRLLKLFNWALREGVSPAGWRRSIIIPVHKKGKPRDDPSSYRPVALTSCMAKLMERMVATRLVYHLESQKILAKCQAGFRKNRSTEEQIARIVQDAFDGLEQKKPQRSVLVLLDFSRAYDRVWKSALYKKMADCQVHGDLIRWTKSFLDDRRGRVKWSETLSKERIFREGLPQGSVLAPTLWLIYCNDLPSHISAAEKRVTISQFADDTALMATHNSIDQCGEWLQTALKATEKWCTAWKVKMSPEKCNYTIITLDPAENNGKKQVTLMLKGKVIEYTKNPTFLGVKLDPQLTFVEHAKDVARKMNTRRRALQAIANKNTGTSQDNLRTAYVTTTRAVAEYAASTWLNMAQPSTRDFMESQQNKCARVVTGCLHPTAQETLLACADLPPLRVVAKQKASCLRERLLRLDADTPARQTAERQVEPRLRSRTYEAARRRGSTSSKDGERPFRGSWRRIAEEGELSATLNAHPREPLMANQHPPWNAIRNPPEFLVGLRDKCKKHLSDERRKGLAMEFIRSLPDTEITAWTDGSVCNKSGGAGAVVYSAQGCKELREGVGILCSSYRTEMWAIAVALRERAVNHPGKSITIFTDSLSAVQSLRRGPTKQDCETGREIWNLLVDGAQNRIAWVPAHCGLDGNERADQVANSAVNAGSGRAQIPLQSAIAAIKCQARQDTATFIGEAKCLSKAKRLDNRRDQVIWNQCMSGYSTVDGATLARFGHERAPNCEHCGNTETIDHIMTACPRGDAIRWTIAGRDFSRQTLIDNPRQLKRLLIGVGKNPY